MDMKIASTALMNLRAARPALQMPPSEYSRKKLWENLLSDYLPIMHNVIWLCQNRRRTWLEMELAYWKKSLLISVIAAAWWQHGDSMVATVTWCSISVLGVAQVWRSTLARIIWHATLIAGCVMESLTALMPVMRTWPSVNVRTTGNCTH